MPESEVRAMRDRGLELAGPGDSPERASLLAVSASWPFAYPDGSPGAIDEYAALGLEAADIAMRLGDADLESGCLDAASSAYCAVGDYGRAIRLFPRRWQLRDRISQEIELVDLHGMGAWMNWEIGAYAEAIPYAEDIEGLNGNPGTVHAQAWRVAALYRLGRWDEALATFARALDLLGDRRESPANAVTHLFAAVALIHDLRGERRDLGNVLGVVAAVPEHSTRLYSWRTLLCLQLGELDRARVLLETPPPSWRVHAGPVWEVRCEDVLARGEWERGDAVAAGARAQALAGGTPAAGVAAQRLEGAVALAAADLDRAVERLAAARQGFLDLGIVWEAARTRRLLAVAYRRSGRLTQAGAEDTEAERSLEALGVVNDPVLAAALAAV